MGGARVDDLLDVPQVATGVGEAGERHGPSSLDGTPRGDGDQPLSRMLCRSGGDCLIEDEAFGRIHSGFKAVGLVACTMLEPTASSGRPHTGEPSSLRLRGVALSDAASAASLRSSSTRSWPCCPTTCPGLCMLQLLQAGQVVGSPSHVGSSGRGLGGAVAVAAGHSAALRRALQRGAVSALVVRPQCRSCITIHPFRHRRCGSPRRVFDPRHSQCSGRASRGPGKRFR